MKKTIYKAGLVLCLIIAGAIFTGCDPTEDDGLGEELAYVLDAAWHDLQTGFTTIFKSDGTYSVSLGATLWQTGTWTGDGSTLTVHPKGDVPATMQYSMSAGGNTMTIISDGEVTVLTKL